MWPSVPSIFFFTRTSKNGNVLFCSSPLVSDVPVDAIKMLEKIFECLLSVCPNHECVMYVSVPLGWLLLRCA